MATALRATLIIAGLLACAGVARAYPVGPPLSLEKLTDETDLIFKGAAASSEAVQDEWFKSYQDFVVRETAFKVISVIKGDKPGETIQFRHYDESPAPQGRMFQPQFYHFDTGRTYIVFAKKTETGVFRQLWPNHTGKEDQGVVLCPNDKPATGKTVKEVLWNELIATLKSDSVSNVTYAIRQLDQMSGGRNAFDGTRDFDRQDVLASIHGLMAGRDSKVVQSAIAVVGSHNPYLSNERTQFWLATVGSAIVPGIGKMDAKMKNLGGEKYWKDLVAIADENTAAETRALAIRALGLVREPSLRPAVSRWLADPEPAVRASATLLLADLPGPDAIRQLTAQANDAEPTVRVAVALSTGFAQQAELADLLGRLLKDTESQVRQAAAMSLLSFSPKNEAIAAVFRANLDQAEFQPLFLNALARETPTPYLDDLAKAVETQLTPSNWWGGEIPAFTAWKILFKDLQGQPAETVRSGKLDHYLDAMERVGNYSSSEPRDIYAFYLQRGMTERARKFRAIAKKRVTYDFDYYFNMVDANPSLYKRE